MLRVLKLAGITVSLCVATAANGQEIATIIPRAMNNLAHEYVICSAYFSVVAIAAENSNDPELAEKYYAVANAALENATMVGEEANLLPETHGARFDIAVKEMSDRIEGNTSNISILFAAHSDNCLTVMDDMTGTLDRFISAEFERQHGYPMPRE